jgi:hypothetical protein
MEKWVPEEALASLTLERDVHPGESSEDQARRIISENAPAAAMSIVNLALRADNDRVRLQAAQFVYDRATAIDAGAKDPWADLLGDCVTFVESETK